jgi:dipeptidyl aminopeptidase/acylaminoacyl peptidase
MKSANCKHYFVPLAGNQRQFTRATASQPPRRDSFRAHRKSSEAPKVPSSQLGRVRVDLQRGVCAAGFFVYYGDMNQSLLCFAALGLVAFAFPTARGAENPAAPGTAKRVKPYTIEQFMKTLRIGGAGFSPDDRQILIHNNQSGIFNVYSVPVAGGPPTQLTRSSKESTFAVDYLPDGRFLYNYDRGGNENEHLYVLEGGQERDLTPGEKVKASFLGWNADKSAFYYMANGRDPRFFDVFKMGVKDFKSTLLYEDTAGYQFGAISRDEKWLAFTKPNTTADSDIYLYELSSKAMKHLSPHQGDASYSPADFDVESKNLYYLTDDGGEFKYLARYDLATGRKETVEKADWDILYAYFSRHGKYRVLAVNDDAHTRITIVETRSGKTVPLPRLPNGDITGVTISDDEKLMAFYFNGDRSPANLYVYDFATAAAKKLTESLNPEISPEDLVESEVVRFKSFDGLPIPNILYRPHGASAASPAPALVWVHGGPGGQTRTGYSPLIQFLVNHGYAVLGINNRGSSGYGKTFFTADDRKHGREPLWDCVEAKKFLKSLGYVDEQKIGIIGGSYGGYMVLAALAFKPEEFKVGVDIFGVANWIRTLESIPPYWESFRNALYKEVGDPKTDRQMLMDTSPLFHADKITRPLIVLQGANDPRVIKPESDDIVNAIKKKGGVVEYVVFDNEGHGFTKKENEIAGNQAILKFLDRYLKGDDSPRKAGVD